MSQAQLIPVSSGTIGNVQCLTVNGRELHSTLGVKRVFAAWITGRIEKYGFVENQDFEVFSNSGKNSEGGRPSQEYLLSLDMGKELCMVENNEKGRVARRYFIECERRLLNQQPATASSALTPSTAADRAPLRALVYAWAQAANLHVSTCWPQVKAHFQLSRIDDLPVEWLQDALDFVQGKMDALAIPAAPSMLPLPPAEPARKPKRHAEPKDIRRELGKVRDAMWKMTCANMEFTKAQAKTARRAFDHPERISNVADPLDIVLLQHE